MSNFDISIISPCFNHGRYVSEMLASAWNQTLPPREVIVVNDGSTDDTRRILDGIRHPRLRIIHTANRGPAAARNTAIKASVSPFVLNLDADDKIAPSFLAKAAARFAADPGLGIVYSDVRFFGARSARFDLPAYSLPAMLKDNIIVSAAVFRKTDWAAVGGFSGELIHGAEDYDFWLAILEHGRGVSRIPEELMFYRTYPNAGASRSGRLKLRRQALIHARLAIFRRHENLFRACPDEYRRMLENKVRWEREHLVVQWLKQLYHSMRRTCRACL